MNSSSQSGRLARFRALSGPDKRLFISAVWWMLIARLMLAFIPFRRLSEKLTVDQTSAGGEPSPDFLGRVGLAVSSAANNVPWRSDCFPQTIAARLLLKRRGYSSTIHLGVERLGDNELSGHAWLSCGDTVVTGGAELERYTEVHQFNA